MTTQDHPTLTGSQDESQTVDPEPTVRQEQDESQPPAAPPDPTNASEVPAPTDQVPPAPADESRAEHESSTDELLFGDEELAELRSRWAAVQAAFVDDPSECVQKADVLVSDLVDQLTTGFANARSRLEEQWARGEQASTEDLRVALMHYREFFERLLAA